jgi:tellurite resistance protein TehA-like permease
MAKGGETHAGQCFSATTAMPIVVVSHGRSPLLFARALSVFSVLSLSLCVWFFAALVRKGNATKQPLVPQHLIGPHAAASVSTRTFLLGATNRTFYIIIIIFFCG